MVAALVVVFLSGCETLGPQFTPVSEVPSDRALVYVFRQKEEIGFLAVHRIVANTRHVCMLKNGSYNWFYAQSGNVTLQALWAVGGTPGRVESDLALNVSPGKTYYVELRGWGMIMGWKLVQLDEQSGARLIQICRFSE